MYTPRGAGVSELGDIEVVPAGDELHLFHLTLPNHDVVQHAVSRDGLRWRPLPAALRTGDPGACDDDQIWTMSVTPRPAPRGGYVMLYTALSTADGGRVQRVAMATSEDLLHWEKSPDNPVAEADPRWYEASLAESGSVSFRDPKPVHVGAGYLATVCARERSGPLPRRGCAGVLHSRDLTTWESRPPLFSPRRYWDLECPQLFRLDSAEGIEPRWYLTAAIMEDRTQRYWMADDATGPFAAPAGGDILAPAGHYAARIARWGGEDLLFAWHQPGLASGWQSSPATVDWVRARNPFGKFLAPPLALSPRLDGSLALGSFSGWERYQQPWREMGLDLNASLPGSGVGAENGSSATTGAMVIARGAGDYHDFLLEGTMQLDAARGGLAFRLDDADCGLFLELVPGSRRVSLERWGVRRDVHDGVIGPAFSRLQEGQQHQQIPTGRQIPVRLLSVGPYVELSLAGEVVIAFMSGAPYGGRWGIWAEQGTCSLRDARIAPMRIPGEDHARDS